RLVAGPDVAATVITVAVAILLVAILAVWARRRRVITGRPFPMATVGLAILVGAPLVAFLATGAPLGIEFPELRGSSFVGVWNIRPELVAFLLGLSLYTASFIAEVVRAGILAVDVGQTEAAYALGLAPLKALRLIVVPQAARVIIPPLTNQYL